MGNYEVITVSSVVFIDTRKPLTVSFAVYSLWELSYNMLVL